MTHPPGTRLGSMRPGPTQPTHTGSHASAATHRQLEEAHLPWRSPHGKTAQGFLARDTLTRRYSQRAGGFNKQNISGIRALHGTVSVKPRGVLAESRNIKVQTTLARSRSKK